MNQLNWTYLGDNGRNYNVGVYHGAQSGHLLVYCNNKIVLIDFSVLDDATYSFFIEDQLCELEIERQDGKFLYGFHINKTADTPRNRIRKKKEKKHLYQSLGFLAVLLLMVAGLYIGVNYWRSNVNEKGITTLLQEFGQETQAKILIASENEDHSVSYYFVANGKGYTVTSKPAGGPLYQNGMPLENGDEFVVRYLPENPNMCKIDYDRPTDRQVEVYLWRAAKKYLSKNPSYTEAQSQCLSQIAYELKGVAGLADFYFQDVPSDQNPDHNTESFQRLVRDLPFQQASKKRCGVAG